MYLKICNKCKIEKDTKEFNNSIKFGLYPTCKRCISKRRKELKMEKILRVKTELHKIVLVENKILKQDGLSQCHTCRTKIPISKTNHYCNDCIKSQREKDKEKVYDIVQVIVEANNDISAINKAKMLIKKKFYRISQIIEKRDYQSEAIDAQNRMGDILKNGIGEDKPWKQ